MTGLMAVIHALRFRRADPGPLRAIPGNAWRALLDRTDRARLTLPLGVRCRESLPEFVRARIDRDLANNAVRHERLRSTLREIMAALDACGVEYAVLKGATHWPYFCEAPHHRPQYDLDVFCPPEALDAARQAIERTGFACLPGRNDGPVDHLPAMVRPTAWRWRGDYYDPELPPSVELHFRFWTPETEGFDIEGPERFWMRRAARNCGELTVPALSLPDTVSYAGLHLLRHLLRGDLCLYHVYELAHLLEHSTGNRQFWEDWAAATPRAFRGLQGIGFRLASRWFGCRLHPFAREAAEAVPRGVSAWCDRFAFSPVTALDRPNKDELLLHFCLVRNAAARRRILARRLFPAPPLAALTARAPSGKWRFVAARAGHHALALTSLIGSLVRWWSARGRRLPPRRTPRADTVPG
jgi:hypothetical protein